MAGHTFIDKARAFLSGLFKKPFKKGWTVPLHILDGLCYDFNPIDRETRDYLYSLVLQGEYKHPLPFDHYLCEEQGIDLLEYNTRKLKETMKKQHIRAWRGFSAT